MTVEAVVAYFGIVLAGCAAVSIADSFAPAEIAMRLRISNAAAIVTQDVIGRGDKLHPLYARVVEAKAPRAVVVPANASAGLQVALLNFAGRLMNQGRRVLLHACIDQLARVQGHVLSYVW